MLCADVISWHACILAAAATGDGQAVLQTSTGQLLLYDWEAGSDLQHMGSFAEPCPEVLPLPSGRSWANLHPRFHVVSEYCRSHHCDGFIRWLFQITMHIIYLYLYLFICIHTAAMVVSAYRVVTLAGHGLAQPVLGISERRRLLLGDQLLAEGCTSAAVRADGPGGAYLLFTTTDSVLHTVPLTQLQAGALVLEDEPTPAR